MYNLLIRDFHPLRLVFPGPFRFLAHSYFAVLLPRTCLNMPGLGSFLFARRYSGNRFFFLFLLLLRCFSSEGSLTFAGVTGSRLTGCPIRISADLFSFANPRSFSQLTTSFFASGSQGIHLAPFFFYLFSHTSSCPGMRLSFFFPPLNYFKEPRRATASPRRTKPDGLWRIRESNP